MDQEFQQKTSSQSLPEKKKNYWRDILAIIALFIFPILGIVIMWFLATWRKKTKIISSLLILYITIIIIWWDFVIFVAPLALLILGVVAMWFLTSWSKEIKIILTLLIIIIPSIIISSLTWTLLTRFKESSEKARILVKMKEVQSMAETVYREEKSYANFDCNYNKEVKKLCKEIEEIVGSNPTIHQSEDEYCVYIKIGSGKYFCIDSTGFADRITVNPGQENYCDGITFACSKKEVKIPKEITISSPAEGKIWTIGETYQIRWTPTNPNEVVEIRLNDLSAPTAALANIWAKANIPNTGEYSFTVPDWFPLSVGNVYQIHILNLTHGYPDALEGYSGLFSIVSE